MQEVVGVEQDLLTAALTQPKVFAQNLPLREHEVPELFRVLLSVTQSNALSPDKRTTGEVTRNERVSFVRVKGASPVGWFSLTVFGVVHLLRAQPLGFFQHLQKACRTLSEHFGTSYQKNTPQISSRAQKWRHSEVGNS